MDLIVGISMIEVRYGWEQAFNTKGEWDHGDLREITLYLLTTTTENIENDGKILAGKTRL